MTLHDGRIFALALLCLAAAAPRHSAQDPATQLRQTETARARQTVAQQKAVRAQAAAAAGAAVLSQRRVAAAARLRDIESQVDDTAQRLHDAAAAAQSAEAEIARRSHDLNVLLPLALRLSLYPSETILAAPAPPEKALEGLLVAHGLAAEVGREVAALRQQQAEAAAMHDAVTRQRAALNAEQARQRQEAAALDREQTAAQVTAAAAQDESGQAAKTAAQLAAQATTLRSAIDAMAAARQQAEARAVQEAAVAARQRRDTEAARNRVSALSRAAGPGLRGAPKISLVAGRVVHAWGDAAEDGPATGVTFSAAPAAFVSSPCTGRVAFSGPFRGYGRLMIIECGASYDFVLAGLGRLDAAVGSLLRAGEPIGRMPDYDPAARTEKPGLYVELRRGGAPVDPMPFLNGKG